MMTKRHAPSATSPKVRVPAACLARTARSVPMTPPRSIARKSLAKIMMFGSTKSAGVSMSLSICLDTAELCRFLQNLWNSRRLHAVLLEHVGRGNVFTKNHLTLEQAMLFAFRKSGKAGQRMHVRLIYHGHKVASARVIPSDERQVRTLRVPYGVPGKARVGHKPAFIDPRRGVRSVAQVVVSRLYVQSILDIGLPAWLVVEFRLDADALAGLFSKNINFMRSTAAGERHTRPCGPAVRAQYLCYELFERKAGRSEFEKRALHRIAGGDGVRLVPPEHIERAAVYLLGRHSRPEFL